MFVFFVVIYNDMIGLFLVLQQALTTKQPGVAFTEASYLRYTE